MTKKRIYLLLISLAMLGGAAAVFNPFLRYHEQRVEASGIPFHDALMELFPVADCSAYIFSITYGSILLYIVLEARTKYRIEKAIMSYAVLVLLRMLTLSILPLSPPELLVPLEDPFLNNLIYPGEVQSDLFFSGHTGLVCVFFFISRRWIFIVLAVVLAVLLMIQRIHYSIDILAAVPFAWVIVRSVEFLVFRTRKA